jgi:hypothetical protein
MQLFKAPADNSIGVEIRLIRPAILEDINTGAFPIIIPARSIQGIFPREVTVTD